MDGVSLYTAGQKVKKRAYDLAPTVFAATTGVLITYGHPGAERANDMVFFGGVRAAQEPGPMSRTNRARDEAVEFDVLFTSYRGGGWAAELEADNAANELLRTFDYYLRQTNTEMRLPPYATDDGVARYCFLLRAESDSFTVVNKAELAVGRNVTVSATFGAVVRIEGTTP